MRTEGRDRTHDRLDAGHPDRRHQRAQRPAGESTSRQPSRSASCGCSRNSATEFIRAFAIPAASSRSAMAGLRAREDSPIASCSASRLATRSGLVRNRSSSANAADGAPRRRSGSTHARSECRERSDVRRRSRTGRRAQSTRGWAGSRRRGATVGGVIGRESHPLRERVEERDVHDRALAAPRAREQRRQDAGVSIHPGGDVGDGDADFARRVRGAGDRDQPDFALNQQVVGFSSCVGPEVP